MEKGTTPKATSPSQNIWLSLVHAIRWLARTAVVATALYVFFPPLWDAAFEADLDALHEAPYIAADRARHLWHKVREGLRDDSGKTNRELSAANSGERP